MRLRQARRAVGVRWPHPFPRKGVDRSIPPQRPFFLERSSSLPRSATQLSVGARLAQDYLSRSYSADLCLTLFCVLQMSQQLSQ